MIGYCNRFNALIHASRNNCGIVVRLGLEGRLFPMAAMIGEWVDLKGAAIEARAARLPQCLSKWS